MSNLHHGYAEGEKVNYTTTGRFPKPINGTVVGSDGGWLRVKGADGVERKTRPGPVSRGHR